MVTPKDLNKTISGQWQFTYNGNTIFMLSYKDLLKAVFDIYKKSGIKKTIDEIEKEIFYQNCKRVPFECEDSDYVFEKKERSCVPCGGSSVIL